MLIGPLLTLGACNKYGVFWPQAVVEKSVDEYNSKLIYPHIEHVLEINDNKLYIRVDTILFKHKNILYTFVPHTTLNNAKEVVISCNFEVELEVIYYE